MPTTPIALYAIEREAAGAYFPLKKTKGEALGIRRGEGLVHSASSSLPASPRSHSREQQHPKGSRCFTSPLFPFFPSTPALSANIGRPYRFGVLTRRGAAAALRYSREGDAIASLRPSVQRQQRGLQRARALVPSPGQRWPCESAPLRSAAECARATCWTKVASAATAIAE